VIPPLKKLFGGLAPSLSFVPFSEALSPVNPESPSKAMNPSVVRTGPDGGVLNPVIGIVVGGADELIETNPSSTVRFRAGCVGSSYTTTSVHPPYRSPPFPVCTFATLYVPGPAAATKLVTSANAPYRVAEPDD
jgi:hypothetical protein